MLFSESEVLEYVRENDVKFIRLSFSDIFGRLKNVSIMPGELPRAFKEGISFDGAAIRGFRGEEASDLLLFPEPSSLMTMPWRPAQGRVVKMLCRICYPDGRPYECDSRRLLQEVLAKAEEQGLTLQIGAECEFYLFRLDDEGNPTKKPQDQGTYCDISPLDRGENMRREICLTLEQMGLKPESSHHEQGPGQNEVDFQYSHGLKAADDCNTFRSTVKALALQNGLFASFMPKPLTQESGSGLHVNLSLLRDEKNLFASPAPADQALCKSFMAGILNRIREISLFLNPLTNSYRRFGAFEAPCYVAWGRQNRSQLIRIPAAEGEYSRLELRSPDAAANPYLAFALIVEAGMEGVRQKEPLQEECTLNLFSKKSQEALSGLERLPKDLGEALELARQSRFVREVLPAEFASGFFSLKEREWQAYLAARDKDVWEEETYFTKI
ncbi:MAG: glutamine synthetase family protein [Peptococcaceae bacterium]|nr:glutamine synthetase family protein [Peptococcaceae bacterium]